MLIKPKGRKNMYEQLITSINAIVEKYEKLLSAKGIKCSVHKRYFETKVSGTSDSRSNIFAVIHRSIAKKREEKQFKYQNNRYHCLVLRFSPVEDNLLKAANCKEYSFSLNKVERTEIGYSPKSKTINEEKLLNKIEKTITKILKKAEKKDTVLLCKENCCDVIRYIMNSEYGYKKTILGKERIFWELLYSGVILLVIIITCFGLHLIIN